MTSTLNSLNKHQLTNVNHMFYLAYLINVNHMDFIVKYKCKKCKILNIYD